MGREEQVEEREVLDSIFPEEITDVSETEYRIAVKLNPPDDDDGDDAAEPPTLVLHVRYPEAYPDEAPILDLSAPANAPPHPRFSVSADKKKLLQGLDETIQENMGMAMIFTIVTTLTEAAEQLMAERKDAVEREREEALLAAEREENKKFHGTPVTPETFLVSFASASSSFRDIKWRDDFMREMAELKVQEEEERLAELKKAKIKEPTRLTGKQLFQRGLAGKVDEEEDDTTPAEQMEKLKVEA
ncbi:RWD-domain-containing protein [Xylariaceae sp. FL1272]|nr:RWD-domain-containing protein [Xylariaceae sp. FL1272]